MVLMGSAYASPASDLVKQYLEFVSQYHVDAEQLDLEGLNTRANQMVQARCGNDVACAASKVYEDLKAMTRGLDATSSFVAEPELLNIRLDQVGDASLDTRYALGLEIRDNIVYRVLAGSSAFEAGFKRGDKILGMSRKGQVWQIANPIFPDSTAVVIRLERAGQAFDLTVTPSAGLLSGLLTPEGRLLENGVGYIRLPSFKAVGSAQKLHNLLANLQTRGMNRLLLDLRFNSGGYLDETLLCLSAFFEGDILKLRSRLGAVTYSIKNGILEAAGSAGKISLEYPSHFKGKVVVLVNAQTASAAEVLALTWQRASYVQFIGENTAGRSRYATLPLRLLDGSELRLAVVRHLYPVGEPLLERLTPDQAVKDNLQALNTGSDPILEAGLKLIEAP